MKVISEIQLVPIKPNNGLVAFCSFVLYENIYVSSIAIYTRPDGSYRLVYPTKKVNGTDMNIFHPINREIGMLIEKEISDKYENVMKNDRYNSLKN